MDNQEKFCAYLLGELSDEEQLRLEEQYFSQEDLYGQLISAEDDLIDAYVRDELSPTRRTRFEEYFLNCDDRRERVKFSRALNQQVNTKPQNTPQDRAKWSWLINRFNPFQPVLQLSLAVMLILVIISAIVLFRENQQLKTELARVKNDSERQQAESELQRELSAVRVELGQLTEKLETERRLRAQLAERLNDRSTEDNSLIASLTLSPISVRNSGNPQQLLLPPGTRKVQLKLLLEEIVDYQNYQARMSTVEGREVFLNKDLKAKQENGLTIVVLTLSDNLSSNDYLIKLRGTTADRGIEDVADYSLRIIKK